MMLVLLALLLAGPDHLRQGYGGPPKLYAKAEGLALPVPAGPARQDPRQIVLKAIAGGVANPFTGSQRATVFVFVRPDCPVSNRYAPELNRLNDEYASRNIRMWLVYPGRVDDEADVRAHHAEYGLRVPALRDPVFELADLAGATMTPEAAVFLADGRVIYRGRIDDRAVRLGAWRPSARARDLARVLDRVARGEHVSPFTTQAVGCYIKPLS